VIVKLEDERQVGTLTLLAAVLTAPVDLRLDHRSRHPFGLP
jgi:hypothetical protein